MLRKTLVVIWLVFSLGWSGMCIFVFFLGAGMSPGDSHIPFAFLLYWLLPIGVPAVLYRVVRKRQSGARNTPGAPD